MDGQTDGWWCVCVHVWMCTQIEWYFFCIFLTLNSIQITFDGALLLFVVRFFFLFLLHFVVSVRFQSKPEWRMKVTIPFVCIQYYCFFFSLNLNCVKLNAFSMLIFNNPHAHGIHECMSKLQTYHIVNFIDCKKISEAFKMKGWYKIFFAALSQYLYWINCQTSFWEMWKHFK